MLIGLCLKKNRKRQQFVNTHSSSSKKKICLKITEICINFKLTLTL